MREEVRLYGSSGAHSSPPWIVFEIQSGSVERGIAIT
jgi:hypothetical protein